MFKCRFCGQIWPGAIRCVSCGAFIFNGDDKQRGSNLDIFQQKLKKMLTRNKRSNSEKD